MADTEKRDESFTYVRLFPTLSMSDGDRTIDEEDIRSDMVVKLLSYLVCNHKRSCTAQELTSALWQDDASVNPVGALKNLAYRLRTILKKTWPDKEFITTGRGSYRWNAELPVVLDIEEFTGEIKKGERAKDPEEKLRHYTRAFELYRGKFLHSLESEHWVMPKVAFYESAYLNLARDLTDLLDNLGQYDTMEQVALTALGIEPFDEKLHAALIRAYIAENRQEDAEEHYRATEKLLYDNLGIGPSDELKKLFAAVMEREHRQETDLAVIQKELKEAADIRGAYLCEYGVFKKIYELESRRVARMGMTIYLSLLTLYMPNHRAEVGHEDREIMEKAMEQMLGVVMDSLRAGDVLTRYSANQYLIMLPACPYENAKMVMERILRNFDRVRRRARVHVQYSLKEMDTVQEGSHGNPVYIVSTLHVQVDRMDPVKKEIEGRISGIALKDSYPFDSASAFMHLVEQLLNRIGKPQPTRLTRSFGREEKYVSYNASPEVLRNPEEIAGERGAAATFDVEFRSRSYSTWQGLLYGEGCEAEPFSSEIELVNKMLGVYGRR